MLIFGFKVLELAEIVSFTVPRNARSRRVMEKIGMTHKTSDDFDHPLLPGRHPFRRHVLYRIDRDAVAPPRETGAAAAGSVNSSTTGDAWDLRNLGRPDASWFALKGARSRQ